MSEGKRIPPRLGDAGPGAFETEAMPVVRGSPQGFEQ
jgi:hypothetical protein